MILIMCLVFFVLGMGMGLQRPKRYVLEKNDTYT